VNSFHPGVQHKETQHFKIIGRRKRHNL
jgi:hypothetical protein